MKIKRIILSILPVVLMYVLSVLYGSCVIVIMDVFNLAHFDELRFDANDLTRLYFCVMPFLPIVMSSYVSKRLSESRAYRIIYISCISFFVFYISSLFINGLMFK